MDSCSLNIKNIYRNIDYKNNNELYIVVTNRTLLSPLHQFGLVLVVVAAAAVVVHELIGVSLASCVLYSLLSL